MDTEKNTQANDWKQREVGALWKKSGKTQNYFSGRINLENYKDQGLVNIVGFSNKAKQDNPSAPDVILYYSAPSTNSAFDLNSESTKEEESGQSISEKVETKISSPTSSKKDAEKEVSKDVEFEDETPF